MINLITTDSYFNLFEILKKELNGKVNTLNGKNLIFCEEKVSLMVERVIFSEYGGSFNTSVYSFGNYLRINRPAQNVLSKEGSAMAVKRILSSVNLDLFRASKINLAPSLYELIIQLKSAKVGVNDLSRAVDGATGVLKNKLKDILTVYSEYQDFLVGGGFDDQSSILNYLPSVIENDQSISDTDVYILGFDGWTSQLRVSIGALMRNAKSVTAILTRGDNVCAYVNETESSFLSLAKDLGLSVNQTFIKSEWVEEGRLLANSLFNPVAQKTQKRNTEKVFVLSAENKFSETERVAEVIRSKVLNNKMRYRDFTVCVPSISEYRDALTRAFSMLEIPFFLDEKKKVVSHPLIRLILSYIDATRKNLERTVLSEFYKNPLFSEDKTLADEFENYVLAYNIDFGRIKKPFEYAPKGEKTLEELNAFRQSVVDCFNSFNLTNLLNKLNVEQKINEFSSLLEGLSEKEESAINSQIYQKVTALLGEMDMMLGTTRLTLTELKNVFLSGVTAMELSIIPQYNDAVFVGSFKETALGKAKCLFVLGLTADVPNVKADVALLTDSDISVLEDIKVLVEPKIRVVNHRSRENVALAVSAFSNELYLSYPITGLGGDKNVKSEVLKTAESLFSVKPFPEKSGYLTYKEGLSTFARSCGDFVDSRINDFTSATTFYTTVGEDKLGGLLQRSNQEVKVKLNSGKEIMEKKFVSPTRIEDYYKCPYRAFLSAGLKLTRRDKGEVDGFSVGNIMHEIFSEYLKEENLCKVYDAESSFAVVKNIAEKILKEEKYSRYFENAVTKNSVNNAIKECAKFCYKNYLALKKSTFKVARTEASFGDGKDFDYPAIKLLDGKVKIVGKIDRVDEQGEYYRIMDYKTVSPNADLDLLFTGKKLQLYLYAAAVDHDKNNPKTLAGIYYMPVSDKFIKEGDKEPALSKGYTLEDPEVLKMHDIGVLESCESIFLDVKDKGVLSVNGGASKEQLKAGVEYALKLSEQAVEQMREGVIVPSPCDERICGYCEYRSLCNAYEPEVRSHGKVDAETIRSSLEGEK